MGNFDNLLLVCLQELLERYNPVHGMSQEERTVATARRVGLDMPIEKKPGDSEDK